MNDFKNDLYIGWDTGAWMTKEKDGLCLLRSDVPGILRLCHTGLSELIVKSTTFVEFLEEVLRKYKIPMELTQGLRITLAIDAPFAFPQALRGLIDGEGATEFGAGALKNPYLFRRTERHVREHLNRNPLSSIQDSIGSQTTKAMHFLAKYQFKNQGNGIWAMKTGNLSVQAIETYPAPCKMNDNGELNPMWVQDWYAELTNGRQQQNEDETDALICAIIAKAFVETPDKLHPPPDPADEWFDAKEGWIWHPDF